MNTSDVHRELALIRGLMEGSQRLLAETWKHQVAWGLLIAVGLVTTWWGQATGNRTLLVWIWPAVLAVGWLFSLTIGYRDARRAPVSNAAGRAFAGIWIGAGVSLSLLGLLGPLVGAYTPMALPGVVAVILGLGYFASGVVAGLGWLRGVGLAWWASGTALLIWRDTWALPALAALVLLLQVGPALVLRRQSATKLETTVIA